nr:MAG TPA: hypothetical protein [Caudoviricetes sp.]
MRTCVHSSSDKSATTDNKFLFAFPAPSIWAGFFFCSLSSVSPSSPFRYSTDTLKYSAIFAKVASLGVFPAAHFVFAAFVNPISSAAADGLIPLSLHSLKKIL